MFVVGPTLIEEEVRDKPLLQRAWRVLQTDEEVQEMLKMSNINTTVRMLYNDHGPVHAAIVAGSSLSMARLLAERGVVLSSLAHGTVRREDHALLIVLLGAYLHDIGNSVHRQSHELIGMKISYDILTRLLPEILPTEDQRIIYRIRSEVANVIYSTAPDVQAITIEGSIVKVADGTDMAEGRARIPYAKGKMDMHALSALSIKKVEIDRGAERPVRIKVYMSSHAGYFQLEHVLIPKIRSSLLRDYVEIQPIMIDAGERYLPLILL